MVSLLRSLLALYGMYALYQKYVLGSSKKQEDADPDRVWKVAEEMPLYGLHSSNPRLSNYSKSKMEADGRMLDYIYHHLEYPLAAEKDDKEAIAVVSFIVELDGSVTNVRLVSDPGYGMGQAAISVAEKLRDSGHRWRPGYRKGRPVRVEYPIPIKFSRSTTFK